MPIFSFRSIRFSRPLPALALAGAGLLLAGAAAALSVGRPAVVATVDLEKVYAALDEQAAADASVEALALTMNRDAESRRESIERLRGELEAFRPGSAAHKETLKRLELELLNYNVMVDFNRQRIEARRAEFIRNIYASIKQTLRSMSEERSIDIVFLDDSIPQIEPADAQRTMQQISARRMLYSSPKLDLSDELIGRMNAEFRARKAGG
ncbi:MAG TPA: OmpH family outer membrane protein [Phycisphaerales bacterium]|nr:OmpH family outer membrane protein [Phycisphaerales bacterium]HMP37316.1 OmpH family outer membrane protein [Phycisphaerales bacterium]